MHKSARIEDCTTRRTKAPDSEADLQVATYLAHADSICRERSFRSECFNHGKAELEWASLYRGISEGCETWKDGGQASKLALSRTALGKDMRESIAVGDLVNVSCERGIWTVVGSRVRNLEPKFQVQLGEDPSTVHWVQSDVVTLMQKASTASH